MHKFTLNLEHDYYLIGIHTSEEDYRLAYLLNKNILTLFKRHSESLNFTNNNSNFSIFKFEDRKTYTDQFLIANKYVGDTENSLQNDLFQISNIPLTETMHLIPEKKKVDYFLKIDGDVSYTFITDLTSKMNTISQIITCYEINPNSLKSKDALIF